MKVIDIYNTDSTNFILITMLQIEYIAYNFKCFFWKNKQVAFIEFLPMRMHYRDVR
jgi:hypothetical protein